jgi:mRNA-degrading endonuclease RelE of RelBE toxin-antitoxin system
MPIKRFDVIYTPLAERDIDDLGFGRSVQVIDDIAIYLETNPYPLGKPRIKKLAGFEPPLYRLRSGDLRAFYRIEGDQVIVLAIRPKKDSERFLKRIHEERAAYQRRPEF